MPSHYDSTAPGFLPEWQLFNVVGYLIEERRRWPIINDSHEDNVLNKFRIWKERHIQMLNKLYSTLLHSTQGETVPVTWSDEKLTLLYCPGRGSNSRPPAHRSFKHGQGVPRPWPYSLGHGGGYTSAPLRNCN